MCWYTLLSYHLSGAQDKDNATTFIMKLECSGISMRRFSYAKEHMLLTYVRISPYTFSIQSVSLFLPLLLEVVRFMNGCSR
jgi:hypothetical protein